MFSFKKMKKLPIKLLLLLFVYFIFQILVALQYWCNALLPLKEIAHFAKMCACTVCVRFVFSQWSPYSW